MMRRVFWFFVGVLLASVVVVSHAATTAAWTGWRDGSAPYCSAATLGELGYSSSFEAAQGACAAYLTAQNLPGPCGGTLSFAAAGYGGSGYPTTYYAATNSAGGGACAAGGVNGLIGSLANQCQTGMVYRNDIGVCTNVNDTAETGGGCNAGKDQLMILDRDSSGNAPIDTDYGGCGFVLSQAKLMLVDGQVKVVGVYTSTGNAATGGSTASGSASTDKQPMCPTGKITNNVSGAVTCIDGTETVPAITQTNGTNALGDAVLTTVKCIGSTCSETVTTSGTAPTTQVNPSSPSASTSDPCGLPGSAPCKIDETGTSDSAGAAAAGTALKGSYDTMKGQADSAASSGDMSALGVPLFTAPADTTGALTNPFSGTHACVNPSITMLGNSVTLDVCGITATLKLILFWALNVMVAMYAWGAFARRREPV